MRIQIDMFEVQLGAAVLLQCETDSGRIVRILADAGVHASGYSADHVQRKLPHAMSSFGDGSHVDLMIGTHYDADHLNGLVPIIEDQSIAITEAWMPPVANDTELHGIDEQPGERNLLALQFSGEDGPNVFRQYMTAKRYACEHLAHIERQADEFRRADGRAFRPLAARSDLDNRAEPKPENWVTFFERHRDDALATLGGIEVTHADSDIFVPQDPFNEFNAHLDKSIFNSNIRAQNLLQILTANWTANNARAATGATNLAYIRKSEAEDAINATALERVVRALRTRGVPIVCQTIPDGKPRRFVWNDRERRFVAGRNLSSQGPEFTLLGPSIGLVKKFWDRLPIGDYMTFALATRLPVKGITPSNQLSYVLRLSFGDQGILICGDAGCVDFKPGPRKPFYPALLNSLLPLHVIQVAHHAGNNAEFYNVLIEAGYAQQTDPSWLLLSHATEDRYRPSKRLR